MSITVNDIMHLNPCEDYTREVVENLWNGKESLSLKEILNLDIDIDDRSWVLTKLVPTEIAVKWAQHCATKAKEYSECAYKVTECADWAADWAASSASSAAYAAYAADWADRANDAWASTVVAAAYANDAADKAARAAYWASKDYRKILKELLEKLVDMTEENQ